MPYRGCARFRRKEIHRAFRWWRKSPVFFVILFLATTLVGCSAPTSPPPEPTSELPTPSPIPATLTATLDVSATPGPLTAATPAIVVESSQGAPTATDIPLAVSLPMELLRIYQPGPGSQVVSPFRVAGWGGPSYKDRVLMRLLGGWPGSC